MTKYIDDKPLSLIVVLTMFVSLIMVLKKNIVRVKASEL